MVKDKYSAVWVSHTSINDFLACPRAYFIHNIYKDPRSGNKVTLMSPPLALGQAVHEVVESLSIIPVATRFAEPLAQKFNVAFGKVSGNFGGFHNEQEEERYKQRGLKMLKRILDHPGPLANLAVKLNMNLPYYWLAEEDNIILCGKIDWIEYIESSDSVHIIDFKTGKSEENADSLQLPIYHLLATNCQKRPVLKVSFWYLNRSDSLLEQSLPDLAKSKERILSVAKKIKLARQLNKFDCPSKQGCRVCRPYEAILNGNATFVGVNDFHQDVYVLPQQDETHEQEDSKIL